MPTHADSLSESLQQKADAYAVQLDDSNATGRRGFEYLNERAIGQRYTLELFGLGVVHDPLPGDEVHRGRLVIPYLTPAGIKAIKYRCMSSHDHKSAAVNCPKYSQPDGQEQRLYNVAAYHSGLDVIGVCEGEIDAITASVHLDIPTMSVPGSSQWTAYGKYWEIDLQDFSTVIIFADGDKPKCMCTPRCEPRETCRNKRRVGTELAKQIAATVGWRGRIVQCPEGEDVNSMVVAGRGDELRQKAGL